MGDLARRRRRRERGRSVFIVRSGVIFGGTVQYTTGQTDGAANITVQSLEDSDSDALALVSELFDEVWVLDSGSSYHVTSNKEWFATYKSGDFGVVYQVDIAPQRIVGMGDIKIKTKDGDELVLQGVRYVTSARRNLISLGELHGVRYVTSDQD